MKLCYGECITYAHITDDTKRKTQDHHRGGIITIEILRPDRPLEDPQRQAKAYRPPEKDTKTCCYLTAVKREDRNHIGVTSFERTDTISSPTLNSERIHQSVTAPQQGVWNVVYGLYLLTVVCIIF